MERPNSGKFIEIFCYVSWLCTKDPGRIGGKNYFSRKGAKAQSAATFLEVFFASLRLCARNTLGKKHFLCKPRFIALKQQF
jgi:hypothetical protein